MSEQNTLLSACAYCHALCYCMFAHADRAAHTHTVESVTTELRRVCVRTAQCSASGVMVELWLFLIKDAYQSKLLCSVCERRHVHSETGVLA